MSAPDERAPLLQQEPHDIAASESSPLLANGVDAHDDSTYQNGSSQRKPSRNPASSGSQWRWPSIIAMVILGALVVLIIFLGFLVPPAVQEYAETAAVIEPTDLQIEEINADGVRARIRANVILDGSRVENINVRRIGKAVTGIMRKLGTQETTVRVYLPQYGNVLAGTAVIPPLVLDIVDGHTNELDFVTDLLPGEIKEFRRIANDWLDGKLKTLKVTGKTQLALRSGLVPLGTHHVAESLVFEAKEIPTLPEYKITRLNLHDAPVDGNGRKVIEADVSATVFNKYPLSLDVPPLGFEVLVPNCDPKLPSISVAEATTSDVKIRAGQNVKADAKGLIRDIPESLTRACPHSSSSPLDRFMDRYLHGKEAQVLVKGKRLNGSDTPHWITDILESVTVPVDFPGRSFDGLIRNFSLTDVEFKLPNPFAGVNNPDSKPRVSGKAVVLAAIPSELDVDLGVDRLRASSDLYYEDRKLGELNLRKWQKVNSTKVDNDDGSEKLLSMTTRVVDAPVDITDSDVFSEVIQALLLGEDDVILDVVAAVDTKVSTVLGMLTVKKIPARGKIPVKHFPQGTFSKIHPQVGDIEILNTSDTGIHLQAIVNITNPTPYTATVPYFNIHITKDGEILGEATARDLDVGLGNNTNILIRATWDPMTYGGRNAHKIGRKLLSDYVSGKNTTLTARAHRESIPNAPLIGEALSAINFTIPTPRIRIPGEESDAKPRFITDATFHVLSSTATFGLLSPLQRNSLHIEYINATAFYNHTEAVGQILHDQPLLVPPGRSTTPKLPVQWSLDSVGYEKLRQALGGTLKLDAEADVTIRMGNFIEDVHYSGKGIGAQVRI